MEIRHYSHNHGIYAVPKDIVAPIEESLQGIQSIAVRRSASSIREKIHAILPILGWSDEVPVVQDSKISITAMNGSIGLCLQTGNMARFYADLLKLQVLYQDKRIEAAIYIIPTRQAATSYGDNLAHFERLTQELPFYRFIITLPILVIGFQEELR